MANDGKNTHNRKLENEIAKTNEKTQDAILQAHKIMKYQKTLEGRIEAEADGEKTYLVRQETLVNAANSGTAKKSFNLELPVLGPYMCDYSSNGNCLLLGGRKGHIATMNWKSSLLQSEFQLHESCNAVKYLNDEQLFAVAQSKYTYIYSREGIEVHQLRDLANVQSLEFLHQHFLLAGGSKSGLLTWFDVSVGKMISLRRSRMGPCCQLRRDTATNVIAAGHQCGQVTMWIPKCPTPVLKLAAHRSTIMDLCYDKGGVYLSTLGVDGYTRIWDLRSMRMLNQIYTPNGCSLDISHKNLLAVGFGSRVEVWSDRFSNHASSKPLIAHNFEEGNTLPFSVRFCPFEDVLGVSHNFGFSSLLIPGAGVAEPDFYNANPFETHKQMRDRPIYQLLDKPNPESIRLSNAPGTSYMKSRNVALLKQKKILSEIHDVSQSLRDDDVHVDLSDDDIVEKKVIGKRLELLTSEAERLERQHKNERKVKRMNGVEKYKLKQRTQGRTETREMRRLLKKKRLGGATSAINFAKNDQHKPKEMDHLDSAAANWFRHS